MDEILVHLDHSIAMRVAVDQGWEAQIEDTTQELVDDNYPLIDNPVTHIQFLQAFIPIFIRNHLLTVGKEALLAEIKSSANTAESSVKGHTFDDLIIAGDFDTIKEALRNAL